MSEEGTLLDDLEATVAKLNHLRDRLFGGDAAAPEVVYPPPGFALGIFNGPVAATIGCWATEEEARAAIKDLRVVVLGPSNRGHF